MQAELSTARGQARAELEAARAEAVAAEEKATAAVEQAVSHLAELAHLQPPALWEMITCQLLGPLWTQRTSSYASAWHSSFEATP